MGEPNYSKMTSMHFYGWKNGLKTGQYYLRSKPSRDAIKFTVDIEQLLNATDNGNSVDILKCLTVDNEKVLANNETPIKRVDRLFSTNGYDVDENGQETGEPMSLDQIIASQASRTQEIEEVDFECLNCGS